MGREGKGWKGLGEGEGKASGGKRACEGKGSRRWARVEGKRESQIDSKGPRGRGG